MVTINMSTEPNDMSPYWTRLSSTENVNKSNSKEQSTTSAYRYAAPTYFATSHYNMENSPVTASAGSRRTRSSSYALPSTLPSSIEMQDIADSSTNTHNAPALGNLPTPANHSNSPAKPPRQTAWLAILLALILLIVSIALHPNFFSPQPWNGISWSCQGMAEYLSVKQVIFTTIPAKVLWGMFLASLGLDVLVLQAVYSYASVAAGNTDARAARFVSLRYLFFLLVVVLQAVLMWGWLLWSI